MQMEVVTSSHPGKRVFSAVLSVSGFTPCFDRSLIRSQLHI